MASEADVPGVVNPGVVNPGEVDHGQIDPQTESRLCNLPLEILQKIEAEVIGSGLMTLKIQQHVGLVLRDPVFFTGKLCKRKQGECYGFDCICKHLLLLNICKKLRLSFTTAFHTALTTSLYSHSGIVPDGRTSPVSPRTFSAPMPLVPVFSSIKVLTIQWNARYIPNLEMLPNLEEVHAEYQMFWKTRLLLPTDSWEKRLDECLETAGLPKGWKKTGLKADGGHKKNKWISRLHDKPKIRSGQVELLFRFFLVPVDVLLRASTGEVLEVDDSRPKLKTD